MSTLETNSIGKYNGNNVSIDDALRFKNYNTTERDALTSVAGDIIYNTSTSKVEYYDGSAWQQAGGVDAFSIEYLVIAGGGGGNTNDDTTHGSGGAGGYLCNVSGENSGGNTSAQPTLFVPKSTNLQVSVGAGGGLNSAGSKSEFTSIMSVGGGTPRVGNYNKCGSAAGPNGRTSAGPTAANTNNIAGQGSASGQGVAVHGSGGAGGAGAAGSNGTNGVGGDGGDGLASSITGSSVTRGGGGGGGGTTGGSGGAGGGGNGGSGINSSGTSGTANTGGGGGGSGNGTGGTPGSGGSGVVILRWATADATIGGTRTGLTDGDVQTDGSNSYIVFTQGEGTVTFS